MDDYTKYKHYKKEYIKMKQHFIKQNSGHAKKVVDVKQIVVGTNYSMILTDDHRTLSYGTAKRVNVGLEINGLDKYADVSTYLNEMMDAYRFKSHVKKIIVAPTIKEVNHIFILTENGVLLHYRSFYGLHAIKPKHIFDRLEMKDDVDNITYISYDTSTAKLCIIVGSYIFIYDNTNFSLFRKVYADLSKVKKVLTNGDTCLVLMDKGDLFHVTNHSSYDQIDQGVVDININAWSSLIVAKHDSISIIQLDAMNTIYEEKILNIMSIADHPLDGASSSTMFKSDLIVSDKKLYKLDPLQGPQQISTPDNVDIKEVVSYHKFITVKTTNDKVLIHGDKDAIERHFRVEQIGNSDWFNLETKFTHVISEIYNEKESALPRFMEYANYYCKEVLKTCSDSVK